MEINLLSKLPLLYDKFINSILTYPIPSESWATCKECVLQRDPKSAYLNTKCCTYYPHLMNYAVGGLLQDDNPLLAEGQQRARTIILAKRGVTPYGVIATTQYEHKRSLVDDLIKKASALNINSGYTRKLAEDLLCPYYQDGFCSVWAYREHCCSTHFCISVGGEDGKAFWKAVDNYLIVTEQKLSKYAMLELGWDAQQVLTERVTSGLLGVENEQDQVDEEKYQRLWGSWAGKEEEFYRQCYKVVTQINEKQFQRIMGLDHDILLKRIHLTHQTFVHPTVPDLLRLNAEAEFIPDVDGWVDVKMTDGYRRRIPRFAEAVLRAFDGQRLTSAILAEFGPLGEYFKRDFLLPVYKNSVLQAV